MLINVLQFLNSPDIAMTPTLDHGSHSCDSTTDMNQDTRYMNKPIDSFTSGSFR